MSKFEKQPSEEYPISIDFSEVLDDDETISTVDVSAKYYHGGSGDATLDVIGSSSISDQTIIVNVKNGTDGCIYKITAVIETSGNNIYEEDIYMMVKDI